MTPDEVKNFSFLFLLSHSKYIVLLYDRTGRPVWAANQNYHSHKTILDRLMTGTLFDFYRVPETGDLNSLDIPPAAAPALDLDSPLQEDSGFEQYPSFPSKNVAELESLAPFLTINTAMTMISLLKLSPERFIGIISFPEIITHLSSVDNKSTVMVDENEVIMGANSLFVNPLGIKDPKMLLGRPLKDFVEFNRPQTDKAGEPDATPFTRTESWTFPDSGPPLTLVNKADCGAKRRAGGVLYANASLHETAYLAWHRPLPVDGHDFEVRVLFRSAELSVPRLLVRGVKFTKNASPDITGYAISSGREGESILKKNTNYVHVFNAPRATGDRDRLMVMAKTRDRFTVDVDRKRLCAWQETVPFLLDTDNLFYLFLRPGESILLKSIAVSSRPSRGRRTVGTVPLRARLKGAKQTYEYNVRVDQRAASLFDRHRNVTLYQFEDITDLAHNIDTLQQERDRLRQLLLQEKRFTGKSPAVSAIREQLPTVADSLLSVLIQGETGTGKEVLAQVVHNLSARKERPFIKIDCLAIPETLIESELFGHEKGAFTGAVASYAGRFEQAQGGTVFLDEVGNLPLSIQAKLLSVLQDRKIQRVGGTRSIPLDFRLIAATNTPLEQLIARGRFRQDLFYRLNQLLVPLPPLRERREDIPLLAGQFLEEANQVYQKRVEKISPRASRALMNGAWPGNIRELKNVVLKGALFCEGDTLEEKHVASAALDSRWAGADSARPAGTAGGARKKCEITRKALVKTLKECRGHVKNASRRLNISRNMTYTLIRRYKIGLAGIRKGR
jgi:transcriptional regulator with PAS, ATPase and Fis domain